jgi:DNA-directed RNA polymerase subunit RPC12/RpoP
MHAFTWFLILYSGSALLGVTALWFFYDRRDRLSFEARRRQKVFHCIRCGGLYSVIKANVSEGESCPDCDYKNYELSY